MSSYINKNESGDESGDESINGSDDENGREDMLYDILLEYRDFTHRYGVIIGDILSISDMQLIYQELCL